jgi:uncharacterized membrane protein YbjE (DUF340 family)
MRNSLIILGCLVVGILGGASGLLPSLLLHQDSAVYALYALLFLVGIEVGANPRVWEVVKRQGAGILLVPLAAIIGTLLGVGLFSWATPGVGLKESLAVGSGFGYYSLASILVGQMGGKTLGVIALLSNMMREMATLLTAPLMARHFGRLAPIVSGGATSMDTTLPIITRSVGPEYAIVAVLSGTVLTLLAPVFITWFLR